MCDCFVKFILEVVLYYMSFGIQPTLALNRVNYPDLESTSRDYEQRGLIHSLDELGAGAARGWP